MGDSKIEWTEKTWNPTVGCEYVSEGCRGCYAAREAFGRLSKNPDYAGLAVRPSPGELPRFTGELRMLPDRLKQPLSWRKPCRVFVNSMSDLFHPDVLKMVYEPTGRPFLAELFAVMAQAQRHTFQILTKRPKLMAMVFGSAQFRLDVNAMLLRDGYPVMRGGMDDPSFRWPKNIWCGTSVEDQKTADFRIPQLLQVSAATRFLSIEPLLGPVTLKEWFGYNDPNDDGAYAARGADDQEIHWVIVGGESGPQARPMHPDWVREIRDECVDAGVPYFFKQWGEWAPLTGYETMGDNRIAMDPDGRSRPLRDALPGPDTVRMGRLGKKNAGRELDGCTWDEYPEVKV